MTRLKNDSQMLHNINTVHDPYMSFVIPTSGLGSGVV